MGLTVSKNIMIYTAFTRHDVIGVKNGEQNKKKKKRKMHDENIAFVV